jgi:hypothetical protein
MRKIGLILFAVVLLSLFTVTPEIHTNAQDAPPLEVGKIALGEVTKAAPETKFTFSGKKDEYYVATLESVDKGLISGDLTVADSSGTAVGKSTTGTNTVYAKLPADGDYTLNVKNRLGDGGKIGVQLYRLNTLEKGAAVDGQIIYRILTDKGRLVSTNAYYLLDGTTDFKLTITLGEQKYPQNSGAGIEYFVSRPRKGDLSNLERLYTGGGDKFVALTVTFKGNPEPHILAVRYNASYVSGSLTLDDVLSQQFSVKVEDN